MSTPTTPTNPSPTTDSAPADIAVPPTARPSDPLQFAATFDESKREDPETVADVRDEAVSVRGSDDGGSHYIGSSGFKNAELQGAREMADWEAEATAWRSEHGGERGGGEMGALDKQVDSAEAHDKGLSKVVYDEVAAQAVQAAPNAHDSSVQMQMRAAELSLSEGAWTGEVAEMAEQDSAPPGVADMARAADEY